MIAFPNPFFWFFIPRILRVFGLLLGVVLTLFGLWYVVTQIAGKPGDNVSVLLIFGLLLIVVVLLCLLLLQGVSLYLFIRHSYLAWVVAVASSSLGLLWGFFCFPCVVLLLFGEQAYILLFSWPVTTLLRSSELYGLYNKDVRRWVNSTRH